MGKLRIEPKENEAMNNNQYTQILETLTRAKAASDEHLIYFDLDENENPAGVRKAFLHVAEQERIPLRVRRMRNTRSLALSFAEAMEDDRRGRIPAEVAQGRILSALSNADKPMKKSEILALAGISPATWNLRVKELQAEGKITRRGTSKDTVYSLV